MQFGVILKIVGIFLMLFSTTMLPPAAVSLIQNDGEFAAFASSFGWTVTSGLLIWAMFRKREVVLRTRDGFVVVVLFWTVLGMFGALPLYLSNNPDISFTNAMFESVSGLTTTGATILKKIDGLPDSILFYRQWMQWLGGMGIIVLAVAVLPMLGVGGMQLYRAETPGPVKDTKLTPRIAETAKALWYIYLGLTIACAVAYKIAGMTTFDAIAHSFSTIAIGGFSTHTDSMAYSGFNPMIQLIAVVFMLIAGVNFALHFFALRARSLKPYFFDSEVRAYLFVIFICALLTVGYLFFMQEYLTFSEALRHGVFQTVSIGTTTGFTTVDYSAWPHYLPVMLLFLSFIGGCAGSTGGGIKVIRILILFKQGLREIKRLIHPAAEVPIKLGGKAVKSRVLEAVWGFFAAYVAAFGIILLLLMATGMEQKVAFSAVAACMNNLGPGFEKLAVHYADVPWVAKWILAFAMLLGRLEIFTLLVILSPAFWRR
jgi:trk system potassium uptake protein TrkH